MNFLADPHMSISFDFVSWNIMDWDLYAPTYLDPMYAVVFSLNLLSSWNVKNHKRKKLI